MSKPDIWTKHLGAYIEARGVDSTPAEIESFHFRLRDLAKDMDTASTSIDFRRELFAVLRERCSIKTNEEVGRLFRFADREIPVDREREVKNLLDEQQIAAADIEEADAKRADAEERARAAQATLRLIDTLTARLLQMRLDLEYVESLPATAKQLIADNEKILRDQIFSLPGFGFRDPWDLAFNVQGVIETLRSLIRDCPARIEFARQQVAAVESELAALKGPASKKSKQAA